MKLIIAKLTDLYMMLSSIYLIPLYSRLPPTLPFILLCSFFYILSSFQISLSILFCSIVAINTIISTINNYTHLYVSIYLSNQTSAIRTYINTANKYTHRTREKLQMFFFPYAILSLPLLWALYWRHQLTRCLLN